MLVSAKSYVRAWGFQGEPLLTLFLPPSEKKGVLTCQGGPAGQRWHQTPDPQEDGTGLRSSLPGRGTSVARWHLPLGDRGKGYRRCISPTQYPALPTPHFCADKGGKAGFPCLGRSSYHACLLQPLPHSYSQLPSHLRWSPFHTFPGSSAHMDR